MFVLLCCYYCALTWTVFDHVLTFDNEVIYVWKRPMRAGSVLFYIMRYLGIASLLAGITILLWLERGSTTDDYVLIYGGDPLSDLEMITFKDIPALQFSVFWLVEIILQTRIFALYGSKRLAVVNGLVFVLEIAAMIGLWYEADALRPPILRALFDSESPVHYPPVDYFDAYPAFYWLPGIVFELWLAALALRKLRPKVLKHDLLSVIVHDSIRYFFLVAIVMVVHVVAVRNSLTAADVDLSFLQAVKGCGIYVAPFVIAGQTIGGSRLVLHLRRAYFRSHDFEASKPGGLSFAARQTSVIPVPSSRFADDSFYVQENPSDDEFMEDVL